MWYWEAEVFDVGANFASSTFTAPVTGKYQLKCFMLLVQTIDTAADLLSNQYCIPLIQAYRLYYHTVDPDFGYNDDVMHYSGSKSFCP